MDYKQLIIRGISYSQTQSGAYALLLEHEETHIKLPVVIGNFEAQSISLGLEKDIHPPRPLTHDLFTKFIVSANYELISVIIYQIVDGVFFSNINFKNKVTEEELILDARTSDAIALAVRFDCPIYTFESILSSAGILSDEFLDEEDEIEIADSDDNEFSKMTKAELEEQLQTAIDQEDYELASKIRDEINKREA